MSLQLEAAVVPAEGRQRVPKAVKWVVPIVGKGVSRAGQVVWRAVRRSGRRNRMGNRPGGSHKEPHDDLTVPGITFWSVPAWDLNTPAMFSVLVPPPDWLTGPLRQLLCPFDTSTTAGQQEHSSAEAAGGSSRASRRRERRAARQQRRAYKRMQKQLQKASKAAAAAGPGLPSTTTSLLLDADFGSSRPENQDAAVAATGAAAGGGWGTHVLAQMINPANTFPMLLHSAKHLQEQQQQSDGSETDAGSTGQLQPRGEPTSNGSSSSVLDGHSRPQQLLTVGCRHWGNGMVQGLLRVKIYDFAIYLDGQQAQAHLPATPLLLDASDSQLAHQQQEAELSSAHDLPAVLKSSSTQVDMSLVLKAARNVPLHLLSAEYEKVLRRRLDRVGGSSEDITALQQLLASFSDARRLPAAVTANSSSGSSSDTQLPAPGAGGSVRKGAMIVFERSRAGDVTARVGPVILGTVSSPKVAEALFDLYLGDQPVSKTAKDAATQTLQRLAASAAPDAAAGPTGFPSPSLLQAQEGGASGSGPQGRRQQLAGYYLPGSKGQEIQCEGQEGRVGGRRGGRKKGAAGGGSSRAAAAAGLDVDELDACVLHMG